MPLLTCCGKCAAGDQHAGVAERDLPACVRDVLEATRAAHPARDLICLSYRVHAGGQQIVEIEAEAECARGRGTGACPLHARDVLVLSVTTTETTFDDVRSVTHVLVMRMRPGTRICGHSTLYPGARVR